MSCTFNDDQLNPSGYIPPPSEWGPCLINMVRAHLGDYTDPPMFTDDRIFQILQAAAFLVYSDITSCPIPKPEVECDGSMTENPLEYPGFANLVVLQAVCMVDRGAMRARMAMEGIKAVAGPASISITSGSSVYAALFAHGACAAYERLKDELCFLNPLKSAEGARQIVSMFVSEYYESCDNRDCSRGPARDYEKREGCC